MAPFLLVLTILTVIAVVAALLLGLALMMRGGELNKKYGNKLMVARVTLQAVSVFLLMVLWFAST